MNAYFIKTVCLLALLVPTQENLIIKHQDQTIFTIDKMIFKTPFPSFPFHDYNKYQSLIQEIDQQIYIPSKDAYITEQGRIQQEQAGIKLNHDSFYQHFLEYYYGNGSKVVVVPTLTIYPRVDSELLAQINVKQIGQYMTFFNSRNQSRSHNIALATEAINNKVVFPGEVFSFNHIVGKRTIEKGYKRAPIIVRGELSEGIGGGICQVSSTLYNAVDRAGVSIMERYSHSKQVPYVPPGRDATVSWYGPDFTFRNNYNQPILIRAKAIYGRVIVTIFSSEFVNVEPRHVPSVAKENYQEILDLP